MVSLKRPGLSYHQLGLLLLKKRPWPIGCYHGPICVPMAELMCLGHDIASAQDQCYDATSDLLS